MDTPAAQPPAPAHPHPIVPPVPSAPKPTNNKFITEILVAIIFLSLSTTGYVLYRNIQLRNEVASLNNKLLLMTQNQPHLIVPPETPTSTPNPTANWKTYTNTLVGFTSKYPETWIESGPVANNDNTIAYFTSDEKIGNGTEAIQYYVWIVESNTLPNTRSYSKESVNGYVSYKTDMEPSRLGTLTYYITNDEKKYIKISLTPCCSNYPSYSEYLGIFDQILSTFKFIDQTNQGSPSGGQHINCPAARPQVCTMICLQPPPYICGSDGKSYCSECQACSNPKVSWYVTQDTPCQK